MPRSARRTPKIPARDSPRGRPRNEKGLANSLNTFEAPAYAVVDASLGHRFESFTVAVSGDNLGNRRDAVQLSELGEGQFYRMVARRVFATLGWQFK
jgi:outer membrane receptor protein involved in Fe transport